MPTVDLFLLDLRVLVVLLCYVFTSCIVDCFGLWLIRPTWVTAAEPAAAVVAREFRILYFQSMSTSNPLGKGGGARHSHGDLCSLLPVRAAIVPRQREQDARSAESFLP